MEHTQLMMIGTHRSYSEWMPLREAYECKTFLLNYIQLTANPVL